MTSPTEKESQCFVSWALQAGNADGINRRLLDAYVSGLRAVRNMVVDELMRRLKARESEICGCTPAESEKKTQASQRRDEVSNILEWLERSI